MHSFGTPSITPYSVIPPSCPALSTAPVVVAISPAGSVPIGRGGRTVRSVRGPVGVVVRFGVGLWGRTLGSDFGVGLWGGYIVIVRLRNTQYSVLHTHFRIGNSRAPLSSCRCAPAILIGRKSSSHSRPTSRVILLAQIGRTYVGVSKWYVNTTQNTKTRIGVDKGTPAPLQYKEERSYEGK